jgi:hypothetical protein
MEALINLYVFILFFLTLAVLSVKKKNRKMARYYTQEHKS